MKVKAFKQQLENEFTGEIVRHPEWTDPTKPGRVGRYTLPPENKIHLWRGANDATEVEELLHALQARMSKALGTISKATEASWEAEVERILLTIGFEIVE